MEINGLSGLSACNETLRGCFISLMYVGLLSREFSTTVNLSPVDLVHLDVIYINVLKTVIFVRQVIARNSVLAVQIPNLLALSLRSTCFHLLLT